MTNDIPPLEPSEEVPETSESSDEMLMISETEETSSGISEEIVSESDEYAEAEDVFEDIELETPKPAALTINIASWATPIVGLIMLIVGLAGGYFLRPVLFSEDTTAAASEQSAEPVAAAPEAQPQQPQQQPQQPQQPQAQEPTDSDRQALMAAILPEVKQFYGDPNAPITLIEFSDFQ